MLHSSAVKSLYYSIWKHEHPAERFVNLATRPVFGYNNPSITIGGTRMKIAGIIAEYNPFHNGHAHHIRMTRETTGCDYVIACMSGSFTQRGEAACMDKWTRARIALECGADAVFDLPALFAVRTADAFARGGVEILSSLGCDILSFGSEISELPLLRRLAELRENEPPELSEAIRKNLDAGMAHARARGEALAAALGLEPSLLNSPNMILAAEYIRAIHGSGCAMQPVAIPRIGAYHDPSLGQFASASAIRAAVHRGETAEAAACVPAACREALAAISIHPMDDLLLHALRSMTEAEIAALPGVNEGLEKRIARCAREAASREELLSMLKCKRYTHARLSRICTHALLGMTQSLLDRHPLPDYARLLGMRTGAQPLMAELKTRSSLPIISDGSKLAGNEIFNFECRATDLRALLCNKPEERKAGQEFTQKFVRV